MMENPRHPISELHLGTFPHSAHFQCWKVNFKTEVSMSWIEEVETAKPVDDFVRSQSIEGCDFPDFEMCDAKIASAVKKPVSNPHFRRRVAASSNTRPIFYEEGRLPV